MDVFIGNIAKNTTLNDVMRFFKGFAKKASFRMVDQQLENGSHAFYALAEFDSDKLALKAIKKLNGGMLRGHQVVLREFIHRSYTNERRALNWRSKPWTGVERRKSERRQRAESKQQEDFNTLLENSKENEQREMEEKDKLSISAYTNMARKL